tara:strand:- start:856 stop:1299 length:444 start_codon:yes stop_codon:yes gene_type:complete
MDLKMILDSWSSDSVIGQTSLDESSRQTPILHAKYLELLSLAKLKLKKAEQDQKILLKDKWLYYNGKMDQEQIADKGWQPDPFDGLKILKGEMDYYYDADPEIQQSVEKIEYLKTIIDTLSEIMNNINWRHQTISNMIKWRVFESGG